MAASERKEAISKLVFIIIINNNLTDEIDKAKQGVNELAGIEIYKIEK